MSEIVFSREHHIGLITLNRSGALNALSLTMIQALKEQLEAWESDSNIYAVLIQAKEGKAFCAGGDIRWLYEMGQKDKAKPLEFFNQEYQLNLYIANYSKPYIALMNGITMGGGVGISMHGTYPIATEHFLFAMPETAIGFFPDIGASYLLSRLPNHLGTYLALTGQKLTLEEASSFGLIHYQLPSSDISLLLEQLCSAKSEHEIKTYLEPLTYHHSKTKFDLIERSFNQTSIEAIIQTLEQSSATWSKDTLDNLKQKSPLSLKVTLALLRWAKNKSLEECLTKDFHLVQQFMRDHDFYEGVRALIIDKDKKPKWNPSTLEAVSELKVQQYLHQ